MGTEFNKGVTGDYATAESGWTTSMNRNWVLLNDAAVLHWATDRANITGLTYAYFGGPCIAADGVVTTQADGTVALTDDATNYVERDRTGSVSANTTEFTPGALPMAEVTTAGGAIDLDTIVDRRTFAAQGYTADEVDTALALKADLASPALTGTPTAPTAAPLTNTTQIATTAYVDAAVTAGGIPATIVDAKGDLIAATAADTVARLAVGSDGQRLRADSAEATGLKWVDDAPEIPFIIDGGGAAITTGVKGNVVLPQGGGTITGWTLLADQSGTIVIDTWKDTYANYPPTVADTIWGGSKPTLSAADKNQATGLSIAFSGGDILRFNVDSAATVQQVTLSITFKKA